MSAQPLPPLLFDSLKAVVPVGSVREAGVLDAVDGVIPECVVQPSSEAELARILAYANGSGLRVAPRGHGTKANWGHTPNEVDVVISTAKLDRVLEHAHHDLTVAVEAGASFASVQQALAQHSQRLALDPLWPDTATIGGVIATNDSGSLRLRFGSVRDLIIGVTVVLPDGTIAKSGGKVVKNVAGYDLPKLMTGAFGTLGIITKAIFRLHPLPEHSRSVSITFASPQAANSFMLAMADSVLVPTGTQMRVGNASLPEVDARFEGIAQSVGAQMNSVARLIGDGELSIERQDVWQSREELWRDRDSATICKLSVLPTQVAPTVDFIHNTLRECAPWKLVAQSIGLALLRIESTDLVAITAFISSLRARLAPHGGAVVVLHCAPELKRRISVWGETRGSQPLMKCIKEKFDPKGTLNCGRFVGGI